MQCFDSSIWPVIKPTDEYDACVQSTKFAFAFVVDFIEIRITQTLHIIIAYSRYKKEFRTKEYKNTELEFAAS